MAVISWSDQALQDLEDNAQFISRDSHYYAKLFVQSILSSVEKLSTLPEIGRVVPELNYSDIREIIQGSYRIIYQYIPNSTNVSILSVYHSSRILLSDNLHL